MASFYGSGGCCSSGGDGVTDYNALINKPIINLTGNTTSPVTLSQLYYGEYLIKGSYTYTIKDPTIRPIGYLLYVSITQDSSTGKKIAKFESFEDGTWYMHTVIFNENETCVENKFTFDKSEGLFFVNENDLPVKGKEKILYITETKIYQWKNNQYVNLSSAEGSGGDGSNPQWGTF